MEKKDFKLVIVHVVTWSDNAEEDLEDLATAADGVGLFTLESRVRDITDEEFRAFQQADPNFFSPTGQQEASVLEHKK
jgi:hypothetical protein